MALLQRRVVRIPLEIVVLILAHGLMGCDGRSVLPIAPSATPLPVPPPRPAASSTVGQEFWELTGTYVGHTGPEACISPVAETAGKPIRSVLVIQRSGESIHVLTDHDHYIGTVVADEFSATETEDTGGMWDCGAARLRYRFEGRVSGRFSTDGRSLSGEEVALFRLESGATIRRSWDWIAIRN